MFTALWRLLAVALVLLAVYCLWPRTASLSGFDPGKMTELHLQLWKRDAKDVSAAVPVLYQLYSGQYGLPPISSTLMAFDVARARQVFASAPDEADQEKALRPLKDGYARFKSALRASWDADVLARVEMSTWVLRKDPKRIKELTVANSEFLGLLYGRPAADFVPIARKLAKAELAAAGSEPLTAKTEAKDAFTNLKKLVAPQAAK